MGMKSYTRWVGFLLLLAFILLSLRFFDKGVFLEQSGQLLQQPFWIAGMFIGYFFAFVLRAIAWKVYLSPSIPFSRYLHALFYSLFLNHLLPIKAGDVVRASFITKNGRVSLEEAFHSVAVLRMLDIAVLGLLTIMGSYSLGYQVSLDYYLISILFVLIGGWVVAKWFGGKRDTRVSRHINLLKQSLTGTKGIFILSLVTVSWVLEAIVVLGVTKSSNLSLSFLEAIWVNSFTISGQVFHFSPGGIGTYESMMSFALKGVAIPLSQAYHVAILSHLFKFLFSYLVGLYVWIREPISFQQLKNWISLKGVRAK